MEKEIGKYVLEKLASGGVSCLLKEFKKNFGKKVSIRANIEGDWQTNFEEYNVSTRKKSKVKADANITVKGLKVKGCTFVKERKWDITNGQIVATSNGVYLIATYEVPKYRFLCGIIMLRIYSSKKMEGFWMGLDENWKKEGGIFVGKYKFYR